MGSAVAAGALWLVASTLAAPPPRPEAREIWCLSPANREHVVQTAKLLDLGSPAGNDLTQIIPSHGDGKGDDPVAIPVWRAESLKDFREACYETYGAFVGLSGDQLDSSLSRLEPNEDKDLAIAFGAGALVGVPLCYLAYWLSKRSREDERRHQQASALRDELTTLSTNLQEIESKRSTGDDVTGEFNASTSRLATQLRSRIPGSVKSAGAATTALTNLETLLRAINTKDAQAVLDTRTKVEDSVGSLIGAIHKRC